MICFPDSNLTLQGVVMESRPSLNQIIFGFTTLYKDHRTATNSSIVDGAQYLVESGFSIVSFGKTKPVADQIPQILSEIELLARNASEFDDFYGLILVLREKAEYAQTLKYAYDESKLHGLLHALACIIINEYKDTDVFKNKIAALIKEEEELMYGENGILATIKNKQGVGSESMRIKRMGIIRELAYLGETKYIIQAMDNNSLQSLSVPTIEYLSKIKFTDPVNSGVPIHLQPIYPKGFYTCTYQTFKNVGYEDFINNKCKDIIVPKVEKPINTNLQTQQQIEEQQAQQLRLAQEKLQEEERLQEERRIKEQKLKIEEQELHIQQQLKKQLAENPPTGTENQNTNGDTPQLKLQSSQEDLTSSNPKIITYPEKGQTSEKNMFNENKQPGSTPPNELKTTNRVRQGKK